MGDIKSISEHSNNSDVRDDGCSSPSLSHQAGILLNLGSKKEKLSTIFKGHALD